MAGIGIFPCNVRVSYLKGGRIAQVKKILPVPQIGAAPLRVVSKPKKTVVFSGQSLKGELREPGRGQKVSNARPRLL